MTSKISSELMDQIREVKRGDSRRLFPVILKTESGSGSEVLAATGMTISNIVASISVVSGQATIETIYALAELAQVKTIEYDGSVSAL